MRQMLEIHHHGEVIARIKIDGALQGVEALGESVGIHGRPDLVESVPDGVSSHACAAVSGEAEKQ